MFLRKRKSICLQYMTIQYCQPTRSWYWKKSLKLWEQLNLIQQLLGLATAKSRRSSLGMHALSSPHWRETRLAFLQCLVQLDICHTMNRSAEPCVSLRRQFIDYNIYYIIDLADCVDLHYLQKLRQGAWNSGTLIIIDRSEHAQLSMYFYRILSSSKFWCTARSARSRLARCVGMKFSKDRWRLSVLSVKSDYGSYFGNVHSGLKKLAIDLTRKSIFWSDWFPTSLSTNEHFIWMSSRFGQIFLLFFRI